MFYCLVWILNVFVLLKSTLLHMLSDLLLLKELSKVSIDKLYRILYNISYDVLIEIRLPQFDHTCRLL